MQLELEIEQLVEPAPDALAQGLAGGVDYCAAAEAQSQQIVGVVMTPFLPSPFLLPTLT